MNRTLFFEPPKYNLDGRQQLWIDACLLSHDTWCGCDSAAVHLLSALLPVGHKDRGLTVDQLIQKGYQQKCLSGGKGEEDGGTTTDLPTEEERNIESQEDGFTDAAIDELLLAAAEDIEPR